MAETAITCTHGYMLAVDKCFGCEATAKTQHKTDIVLVFLSGATTARSLCRECGQPAGHAAHWTAEGTPVDGPYPVVAEAIDEGVALNVTEFVTDLVVTLAQGALASEFLDLVETYETASEHDGHAREQLLVEQIVEQLPTRLPVYAGRASSLATEIQRLARRVLDAKAGVA